MSLINQMLQDLDKRRAGDAAGSGLPNVVRPFHLRRDSRKTLLAAGAALLVLGAGGAFWYIDVYLTPPVPVPPLLAVRPIVQVAPDKPPAVPETPVQPASPPSPVAAPEPVAAQASEKNLDDTTAPAPRAVATPVAKPASRSDLKLALKLESKYEPKSEPKSTASPARIPPAAADTVPMAAAQPSAARSQRSAGAVSIEKSSPTGNIGESADVEYRRALVIINQGRTAESLDALRMALKLNSAHLEARQLLLKLLIENKQFDEADGILRAGLALHPRQLAWAMSLARLQLDRGDLAGAWKTLENSLPAAAGSADYQGFAGHLLQRQGRSKEAADCYQLATQLTPTEGRWWLGLGLALAADGREAQAREAFANAKASGSLSADLQTYVEQKLR